MVLMLLSASFVGVSYRVEKSSTVFYDGNTLYVGGSGEGNYTKIQDAINDASDGDTVFVYNGTYYENVIINKSIELIGENKNTTIIDGFRNGDVVFISVNFTKISHFTIQNASWLNSGINIRSNNNTLENNIVRLNNGNGIRLLHTDNNAIIGNIIHTNSYVAIHGDYSDGNLVVKNHVYANSEYGIHFDSCNYNNILENNISHGYGGIKFFRSLYNNISRNTLINIFFAESGYNNIYYNNISCPSYDGIHFISYSNGNVIVGNNIISCANHGIFIVDKSNIIYHNNFIDNHPNARDSGNNIWDNGPFSGGNYWDDYNGIDEDEDGIGDTPYNISGGNNIDNYPLMEPWEYKLSSVEIINPKEGYIHLFGKSLLPTPFDIIADTLSIGGFRLRPIQVNAKDNDNKPGGLMVSLYINNEDKGYGSLNPETGYYEWQWTGKAFGEYHLKVKARDIYGRESWEFMDVWNFCFLP